MPPVFLVDDEAHVLNSLSLFLRGSGIKEVVTVQESRDLLPMMLRQKAMTVILDLFMPNVSGIELLPEIIRHFPEVPVVVVTASQEVETAVTCMREGAFDYLVKPVEKTRFVTSVRRAVDTFLLRQEVHALKSYLIHGGLNHREAFNRILTNSSQMKGIFQYIEAVAGSGETILITGETGVGKGLLAEAAHGVSGRTGHFISLNVAGLDDTLFSDTLFGHRKGAFSGADSNREGLVARAAGGTLFLDEIGDLKAASQVKLLRLLQEQSYYPLGSDVPKLSSARIVAATNNDLRKMVANGEFRQDLYYRLNAHRVEIPPLRERPEDIPLLLGYFTQDAARAMNKAVPNTPSQLLTLLAAHPFPGNVRELRALVFDAVARHPGGPTLSMESFHQAIRNHHQPTVTPIERASHDSAAGNPFGLFSSGQFPTLKEGIDAMVHEAMRRANNNQGIAATLLGITRQSLNRRLINMRAKQAVLDLE
ncbi:MAG: sigma-54-dependent Fis family transcriptional regulator [Magnetococcales bacterium]|nr:sigma-54-dependent Fis family transcriptional regulator [Magnetococcales bacterium]NGZ05303.1 sigma-54-dependent Fis family transcriptional regulator [Magnetococcales bacterium]